MFIKVSSIFPEITNIISPKHLANIPREPKINTLKTISLSLYLYSPTALFHTHGNYYCVGGDMNAEEKREKTKSQTSFKIQNKEKKLGKTKTLNNYAWRQSESKYFNVYKKGGRDNSTSKGILIWISCGIGRG